MDTKYGGSGWDGKDIQNDRLYYRCWIPRSLSDTESEPLALVDNRGFIMVEEECQELIRRLQLGLSLYDKGDILRHNIDLHHKHMERGG
jgi:hypothetical protein